MNVEVLTICLLILFPSTDAAISNQCLCKAAAAKSTFSSCYDAFTSLQSPSDGMYTINQGIGKKFRVYCEFRSNCIYTYIAPTNLTYIDLSEFYTNTRKVLIRHKLTNGIQYEVRYGQINRFSDLAISIQFNSTTGYKPLQNDVMFPFVYVGLVPAASVNKGDRYGYQANGQDFEFTNCDGNQNTYFALLFNGNGEATTGRVSNRENFMDNWIEQSEPVPPMRNLPNKFFVQFEMHMGGCGGYFTSDHVPDIVGATFGFCYELTYSSCFDAYEQSANPVSGEYLIENGLGDTYLVYCEFRTDRIYTYIAPTDLTTINIADLFNNNTEVLIRHKFSDGIQYEVSYGQIDAFSDVDLFIQYNTNPGFNNTLNQAMGPFVYVGLLPRSDMVQGGVYGYRVAAQDFVFTNCDGNTNSYFAMLFNANDSPTTGRGAIRSDFMSKWRTEASPVTPDRNLDDEFFVQYEFHLGGCGGYITSDHLSGVQGVTFGLRYDL